MAAARDAVDPSDASKPPDQDKTCGTLQDRGGVACLGPATCDNEASRKTLLSSADRRTWVRLSNYVV
jgi:hypothetical protein